MLSMKNCLRVETVEKVTKTIGRNDEEDDQMSIPQTDRAQGDWELSEDFYKEDENRKELRLEDFLENGVAEGEPEADLAALGVDVQRVAADVRRVKELMMQGKIVVEIAGEMGVEQKYVSDIQICIQSFPEDNEIAVAHLILMG